MPPAGQPHTYEYQCFHHVDMAATSAVDLVTRETNILGVTAAAETTAETCEQVQHTRQANQRGRRNM